MKSFKIAHLYYDLMNLYGENGNIRYLSKKIEEQGIKVNVDYLSLEDEIDFSKYDMFYIGTGSEENQLLVIEDIVNYKDSIKEASKNVLMSVAYDDSDTGEQLKDLVYSIMNSNKEATSNEYSKICAALKNEIVKRTVQ